MHNKNKTNQDHTSFNQNKNYIKANNVKIKTRHIFKTHKIFTNEKLFYDRIFRDSKCVNAQSEIHNEVKNTIRDEQMG